MIFSHIYPPLAVLIYVHIVLIHLKKHEWVHRIFWVSVYLKDTCIILGSIRYILMFKEYFHIKKYEKHKVIMDFVNKHRGKNACTPMFSITRKLGSRRKIEYLYMWIVCEYIYIYTHTHIYIYRNMHNMHTHIAQYIYMHILHTHIYMYMHMCIHPYIGLPRWLRGKEPTC